MPIHLGTAYGCSRASRGHLHVRHWSACILSSCVLWKADKESCRGSFVVVVVVFSGRISTSSVCVDRSLVDWWRQRAHDAQSPKSLGPGPSKLANLWLR